MTYRDFYDHALTELNKVEAPTLLLEDFNYFANKSVQQYINQVYNRFDTSQQSSDDLRVLQKSDILDVINVCNSSTVKPREISCFVDCIKLFLVNLILSLSVVSTFEASLGLNNSPVESMW